MLLSQSDFETKTEILLKDNFTLSNHVLVLNDNRGERSGSSTKVFATRAYSPPENAL